MDNSSEFTDYFVKITIQGPRTPLCQRSALSSLASSPWHHFGGTKKINKWANIPIITQMKARRQGQKTDRFMGLDAGMGRGEKDGAGALAAVSEIKGGREVVQLHEIRNHYCITQGSFAGQRGLWKPARPSPTSGSQNNGVSEIASLLTSPESQDPAHEKLLQKRSHVCSLLSGSPCVLLMFEF